MGTGRVDVSADDVALVSLRCMRRSTIKLALRIERPGSAGWREMGMDTRSCGPTGLVGTPIRYRIVGDRGLLVKRPRYEEDVDGGVGGCGGRS